MAPSISVYLDLTPDAARQQWQRIRGRVARSRQEPFLPVETLLCYGLFFVVDPHGFGGSNVHRLPPSVRVLAATLRRPPNSLTHKMLNLEGALPHAARAEPELFLHLAAQPTRFHALYRTIVLAARDAGFDASGVPDFLGVIDAGDVPMLGQDELGERELRLALQERRERMDEMSRTFDFREEETCRLVEQQVRLGQHRFARDVLANYDHRCGFCGFGPRDLQGHRLLIASHIKPWAESSDRERLDRRNGIAACPIHDAAFDAGLLAVNGGLRIRRAAALEENVERDAQYRRYFGGDAIGPSLLLPAGGVAPADRYLRYHRERIFRAANS